MNNTKRKFNALLSSIGSPSVEDLSKSPKQARTAYHSKPSHNNTTTNTITTSIRERFGILPTKTSRTAAVASMSMNELRAKGLETRRSKNATIDEENKPSYLPASREQFLERLKTYRNISDWMPKPAGVDEVAFAKRGWVCKGSERVRCVTCNVEVKVKLNKQEDGEGNTKLVGQAAGIDEALIKKYQELLISTHSPSCPWGQRGCDNSIFKQPIYPTTHTLSTLKTRYHSFLTPQMIDKLPAESTFNLPSTFHLSDIVKHLPPNFLTLDREEEDGSHTPQSQPLNRPALLLAIFGFTARPEHVPKKGSAHCLVCFRNIGLWLYRPREVTSPDGTPGRRSPVDSNLVLLECHRSYCPWVNAESQCPGTKAGEAKPIWETVVDILAKEHQHRKERGTSSRPATMHGNGQTLEQVLSGSTVDDEEYERGRDEKDRERWARLRRVKTLFEGKKKRLEKK